MSDDLRRSMGFRLTARPRSILSRPKAFAQSAETAVIAELDRVTIGCEVEGDEGELVPAGSTGTVVAIWAGGAAFEVEFATPVSALATVKAAAISSHHPR